MEWKGIVPTLCPLIINPFTWGYNWYVLTLRDSDRLCQCQCWKKEKLCIQNDSVYKPSNRSLYSFDKTQVRYDKGFVKLWYPAPPCVVQTAECTPCIILHTSWIPGERVYDVGVFRVLDIYKYTQRLLRASHCDFSTSTIPGFYIHPHPHEKGVKPNLFLLWWAWLQTDCYKRRYIF